MRIFITEEEFGSFLPNILPTVGNEVKMLDKLGTYITQAEEWAIMQLCGEDIFNDICNTPVETYLHHTLSRLVLSVALHAAIPAINLVVTPNGLATVGTQTLVAASSARVEALMNSLLVIRDESIVALLSQLRSMPKWCASECGQFFRKNLFPDFMAVEALNTPKGQWWEKYCELRPKLSALESELAEGYFSLELMDQLRDEVLSRKYVNIQHTKLIDDIRQGICIKMQSGKYPPHFLSDTVDYIRKHPEWFPLWHNSETAKLFTPPVFRNDKKSSGYFF
ncbi:MAG: hypothetical protein NC217_07710 [Muribaculaceae bacterium]|nr:hypothetical protein [Muribaculaceae bacterium]